MTEYPEAFLQSVIRQFRTEGIFQRVKRFGNGHINDTFLVTCADPNRQYILQRINGHVFSHPEQVMANMAAVTAYLKEAVRQSGGNPEREVLTLIPVHNGNLFYQDHHCGFWRMTLFLEQAYCLEAAASPTEFRQSGFAFGSFQKQLAAFPADTLYETIPCFHDTPKRLSDFQKAVSEETCGRVKTVAEEIEFILERAPFTTILAHAYAAGDIPLRVTHNDTKLNNIMFDSNTRKPLCILDLDTVMPGFSATDFGDAIRFGANTAEEDERDLSIVHFDLSMYQAFAEGFLAGCGDILTRKEISLLPSSAKLITLENSMRFLADYLEGDHYYHTSRPGQNLDRCRTHLKLVWEMEQQWKQMNDIIAEIRKNQGEKK